MTLEKCPWCGADDPLYDACSLYVTCPSCRAEGPVRDSNGEMWNSLSRRVHAEPPPETGPMPWRLQIAARGMADMLSLSDYQESLGDEAPAHLVKLRAVLATADLLIGLHRVTEKGGAA